MHTNLFKKTILALIICSIFVIPKPSQALWGMGDVVSNPVNDASQIAQQVGQVTEIVNMVQSVLKEFGLDVVIYKLAQQASQKLIAKVLNNQTGGAGGGEGFGNVEYNFVDNFQNHFQNLNDQEFGKFIKYLDNDTSNPYSKYISRAMNENHVSGGNPLSQFSLDKIPGVSDWNQASNDISSAGSGGWDFYSQLSNPVNTPTGSSMIAREQFANQITQKTEVAKTELTSSGFKPDKGGDCTSSPDKYTENADSVTLDKPDCSSANVKTPSSIGSSQSSQATNEAFERLRNSDELGKILMNTISQLVTGLIKKGFSSLNSDGGSGTKLYGGPQDLSRLLNDGNSKWSSAPQQIVDLRSDLDSAIIKTNLELGFINQAIESVKAPIVGQVCNADNTDCVSSVAVKLEACIPGPDTDYATRFQDYVLVQVKDTQLRAGEEGDKRGTNNADALTMINRLSKQAAEETKIVISNPFLNIPGASEMRSSLREFYKLSSQFHGMVDTVILKRQTLNSLQSLRAQVLAYATQNQLNLTLFDNQWNALSGAAKTQLYGTTVGADVALLPQDENERDLEMKDKVYDDQWDKWETIMGTQEMQTKRDQLYAQYVSMGRDISDSSTVQNTKLKTESAQYQAEELKKILDDCLILRNYAATSGSFPIPEAIKNSLTTDRIKSVVDGPSIFNAVQNLGQAEFDKLNERIIQETQDLPGPGNPTSEQENSPNTLQVNLPRNSQELIQQDKDGLLFCRLTNYHLIYWTPKKLGEAIAGAPIGCSITFSTTLDQITPPQGDGMRRIHPLGDRWGSLPNPSITAVKKIDPHWYHTNAAEILFNMGDN